MADPAVNIASFLSSQSTSLTIGVNLFIGPVQPVSAYIPADSVFVVPEPGPSALRVFGSTQEQRLPQVQVRVRASTYPLGRARAYHIHNLLQSASVSGYMDCYSMQSEPLFIEQDSNNRFHFSDNFQLRYQ